MTRRIPQVWDRVAYDRLKLLWGSRLTIAAIAREFGCRPGTVRTHARILQLPKRRKKQVRTRAYHEAMRTMRQ